MDTLTFENAVEHSTPPAAAARLAQAPSRSGTVYRHMHPMVLGLMTACFVVMMLVFWATFRSSSEASFMVIISTIYLGMYVGTPLAMLRSREQVLGEIEHEGRFRQFLAGRLDTFTGQLSGWDVLTQVCGIPFALMLATIGICLAITFS